jgi:hypothetical protein
MSTKDYLAMRKVDPEDREDHGVKGMKWGVRKPRGSASGTGGIKAALGRKSKTPEKPAPKPSGPETSSQKYDRLLAQSKAKGANSLHDEELRFVTQRADAIAKINKLHQQNPNFVKDAVKQALKNAAKREMQNIAAGIAKKYISDELLGSTKK